MTIKSHRMRLHPSKEQLPYFAKAAGTSRFTWNWALAEWKRQYAVYAAVKEGRACAYPSLDEKGEPVKPKAPSALKLKKQFTAIKRAEFPWMYEVTKNASDQPFLDLGKAFTAFFKGQNRHPKFKSRKRSRDSFYLANDQFEVGDHRVWIPNLGWVNMAEKLRFRGKIMGARVTRSASWWFISIQVEMPPSTPLSPERPSIGVDLGLNRFATMSDGQVAENQRCLGTQLKKLRAANKRLHRRVKGSANREKARRAVARLHYKIACLRDDTLHKLTTTLAARFAFIGIEDLGVKGMMKNRRLARSLSDVAFHRFLSLLSNKVEATGGVVIKVDRFFPSSQICSCCRWRWTDITLADRLFICQDCGVVMDRDLNASLNILQEALRLFAEWQSKGKADPGTGSDGSLISPADLV